MNRFKPLALMLSVLFAASGAAKAVDEAPPPANNRADQGLAAGLEMMQQNASLLRNGDNIWERLREGFQMATVNDPIVQQQTRYYASHPDVFKRTLNRGNKYLFYILNEVERRGMPTELALLPMVESAFIPTATSPVGAAGLWQFMPMTGRQYGLEQTWWYDGRRDVTAATNAALDYLQTLYAQFGDWSLALAAYNWGEGRVARAIARSQAAGLPGTFENIRMPAETRNYVPKLLAIRDLLADPKHYGLHLEKLPNKPYFVALSPKRHMDVELAARLAGISVKEFMELNPGFKLPVYAYKAGRQMLLPAKTADQFQANLEKWNKPLLTWQVYTPSGDESVAEVASRTGMSSAQLVTVNRISGQLLTAGRPLLVAMKQSTLDTKPLQITETQVAMTDQPSAVEPTTTDDTAKTRPVIQVASNDLPMPRTTASPPPPPVNAVDALATQPIQLASNDKVSTPVAPATSPATPATIKVAMVEPVPQMAQALPTQHIVAQGDTLFNIARRYSLSVSELKQLNGLSNNSVRIGQTLQLKLRPTQQADDSGSEKPTPAAKPIPAQYVVQHGDTVSSIARHFGIDGSQIIRLNNAQQLNTLRPGQVLVINGL